MQLVFSDAQYWTSFLPLTFTRPVAELRCGILTFAERWQRILGTSQIAFLTENYLQQKFLPPKEELSLVLVPNFLPTDTVIQQIQSLKPNEALVYNDEIIATNVHLSEFSLDNIEKITEITEPLLFFKQPTDLFIHNAVAIEFDFKLLTYGRKSEPLSETNNLLGDKKDLFIEKGAVVELSNLNTRTGKIYIGKNTEIMEGCNLRGPIALCEGSKINMGAKVYGATTIGPYSKVGGEVSNLIILSYSNKAHDGFMGNSVVGQWCNIGADTNTSNLKMNYNTVKLYNYQTDKKECTNHLFVGTIMGDHSKTSINTQLNTGTIVGVAAHIFKCNGFAPQHVYSFSWGGHHSDEKSPIEKIYEIAQRVMHRRDVELLEEDKNILLYIYENYS